MSRDKKPFTCIGKNNNGLIYHRLISATVLYLLTTVLYFLYSTLDILWHIKYCFVFDPPMQSTINHFIMPNMHPKYYYVVSCPSLTELSNGMINCSLGDDKVPLYAYGDTCNFTCNTGYELTGSDTRTCLSDGSWSGSDNFCIRGKLY